MATLNLRVAMIDKRIFWQIDLAKRYNVNERTIQRWKKSGKLPPPDLKMPPHGREAWTDTVIETHEKSFVGGPESTEPALTTPAA